MYLEEQSNQSVIEEHLSRFFDVALDSGRRGKVHAVREYGIYFERMFQGLYINSLQKAIINERNKREGSNNNIRPPELTTFSKSDVQDKLPH